ncbi:hypothetical protein JY97_16285 [Alkalispirochaeta odontotermitis]|nr:hypothetical protein JY97_16285 [Alkalispirochaeta odontotermitis]CAB1075953.1 contains Pfam profile PF04654: Protein of unknown function, DUF599 / hypothetical protein [Olavius algarvensis Delta 1 endosymbiont]
MLEPIFVLISLASIIAYQVHLVFMVRRKPLTTMVGITNRVRCKWVQSVMADRHDILAVQTLRNQMMAATFLASTAILISLGLLGAAIRPGLFGEISQALNLTGARADTLWMLKLMILAVLFFSAFFNFTLTIRYYNHTGFMINLAESGEAVASVKGVAEVLNLGALHYTLGMRGYYLSVPLVLWIFGPLCMLAGTAVLLGVLYRLDRKM